MKGNRLAILFVAALMVLVTTVMLPQFTDNVSEADSNDWTISSFDDLKQAAESTSGGGHLILLPT